MRVMAVIGMVLSFALAFAGLGGAPARADSGGCSRRGFGDAPCVGGEIGADGVTVQGMVTLPPSAGGDHEAGPASGGEAGPSVPQVPHPVPRQDRLAADADGPCLPGKGSCLDGRHAFLPPAKAPAKPADPAPAVPVGPGVTVEDVAAFVPRSASIRSQPNGWALVGAPVNLLTDATEQVVDGTLLGRPAQVRFVPVGFVWDHGDSTTATVQGSGASWAQLGQADFTPTGTSHVYGSVGDRQVSVTIAYAPSYRFDGGAWQGITGTLPVQVGPVLLHVVQGSTVLVPGPCGTRHAGPGC